MGGEGKLRHVPPPFIAALIVALAAQILFWSEAQNIRIPWSGVELAPTPIAARATALGDTQFYYRTAGLGLQNMGDWAGEMTPLAQYDYGRLRGWFRLLSQMDPESQYAPSLAAYYYGFSPDPDDVRQVIGYLQEIAADKPRAHWRWLAYSVYLARYRVKDPQLGLALARQLAALPVADMPVWTRQLPAFVLADAGEKEAAKDILEAILATTPDLHPAEQFFIRNYIATRLGFSSKTR
ncbi:MAG: hypothetical protein Dbin4_00102 [Alphaproteobacteria bacterium]|nr:hypothetical protein [Alphaproteobacteria bacterium]